MPSPQLPLLEALRPFGDSSYPWYAELIEDAGPFTLGPRQQQFERTCIGAATDALQMSSSPAGPAAAASHGRLPAPLRLRNQQALLHGSWPSGCGAVRHKAASLRRANFQKILRNLWRRPWLNAKVD